MAFGEQVTEHLRNAIVSGDLRRGERLIEEQLAGQFGVSRGPIRDALRRLEIESLVESRRSGTYVRGITEADIDELYSLRLAIESLAANLVMDRAGTEGWRQLAEIVQQMDTVADTGDAEAFALADIHFHEALYALSQHKRIHDIWRQYEPMLATLLRATVILDDDLRQTADKHRVLLEVLKSGDHEVAAAELRDHLENSHQRMLRAHRHATTTEPTRDSHDQNKQAEGRA